MLLMTFVMVKITERPGFCRSCHIMEPYYQGWVTSSHKDVPCVKCHYAPGFQSELRGKFQALSQLAKYFTGTEGTRPWAEIDDAACLRSGCHDTRLLEGSLTFENVRFDHSHHLVDLRRGKRLRCTSCHSQVVMGEHITVTTPTCILCHFKNRPPDEPLAGCVGCHTIPEETKTLPGGLSFVHKEYVERGVACVACHASVTRGDGFVPRSRCYVCHNFSVEKFLHEDWTDSLHQKHVADRKVECSNCHEEITHGFESDRRTAELDCRRCHVGMHRSVQRLADGSAADLLGETEPRVGPMIAARVDCLSCHSDSRPAGPARDGFTRVAVNQACIDCHGASAAQILPGWRGHFERRLREVNAAIASSRAPRAARDEARRLLEAVRNGHAVHNPILARDLLDQAERLARGRQDTTTVRTPATGFRCDYCHLDPFVKRGPIRFQGLRFDHEPHIGTMGLACERCHAVPSRNFPDGPHGRVTISKRDCLACHHRQTGGCAACHGTGPPPRTRWRDLSFSHAPHAAAGLPCGRCHATAARGTAMNVRVRPRDCADCHHQRVGSEGKCGVCHAATLKVTTRFRAAQLPHKAHVAMGLECGDCHKATRTGVTLAPTCQTCHHEEGMTPECASCHPE
jgi:nitrate/TMAO reductase-like tetraheme cytochrome c subunit